MVLAMNAMLATLNHADVPFGYPKQGRDIATSCAIVEQCANGGNVCIGKFGFWVTLTNKVLPTLNGINRVLAFAPWRQVRRINAARVVA